MVQSTFKCPRLNPWRNPFFFLLGLSWSDHFYILAGNTAGNGDSEKHMVGVLAITLSSENSSPSCQFLNGCYFIKKSRKILSLLVLKCPYHLLN